MHRPLFHISLPADWDQALTDDAVTMSTRGVTLAEEGFVHCSFAEQVGATAARYYGDLAEIVLLRIDAGRVTGEIVVEDLIGSGEAFPHIYGPIDIAAVVDATPVVPKAAGDLAMRLAGE